MQQSCSAVQCVQLCAGTAPTCILKLPPHASCAALCRDSRRTCCIVSTCRSDSACRQTLTCVCVIPFIYARERGRHTPHGYESYHRRPPTPLGHCIQYRGAESERLRGALRTRLRSGGKRGGGGGSKSRARERQGVRGTRPEGRRSPEPPNPHNRRGRPPLSDAQGAPQKSTGGNTPPGIRPS